MAFRFGFCRGGDGTCDCERFTRQAADGPPICWECTHGMSKHPDATPMEHSPSPLVDPLPPPPSQPRTPATMPATTSNGKILGLFRNLTAIQQRTTVPLAARSEALATFSSQKRAEYKKLAKGPAPANPTKVSQKVHISTGSNYAQSRSDSSSSIFHVSSVAMIVCGIGKDGNLRRPKAPAGKTYFSEVQSMRNRRCFIPSTAGGNVPINSSWSFTDVDKQLREWFPHVFQYLDEHLNRKRGSSGHPHSKMPDWQLLMCHRGLFSIVQVVRPNGSTLMENKGRGKAGIADSTLWFASRKAVPDDIYESWNTEPIVVGSDSDSDSYDFSANDTDVISISGTGSNSGNASDIDVKLSSSMIDLELDDHSTRAVLLDRGKGVAKQQKTPPRQSGELSSPLSAHPRAHFSSTGKRSCALRSPVQSPPAGKRQKNLLPRPTPLFLPSESPQLEVPQVSATPSFVSVSEDDMLLRGRHYPDSPGASPIINPWVEDLENYPALSLKSFLSLI
ncbi:hypothetical protein EDD15DRAFT_2423402 [Pisolithus albus]|nr:hypothetical protein EDD15DRAFT_2423402 [Pisolithus albus]